MIIRFLHLLSWTLRRPSDARIAFSDRTFGVIRVKVYDDVNHELEDDMPSVIRWDGD